jgi:hypothetical protein
MVDPDSGRYLSEDYAFCRRWRDIGGKVHVDLQCKLMHLGQHLFRGDLAESLRLQGRWSEGGWIRLFVFLLFLLLGEPASLHPTAVGGNPFGAGRRWRGERQID